jgi:hypothetical protein
MSEVHHVVFDPDQLARTIDRLERESSDPESAGQIGGIAKMLIGELQAREAWLMSVYTLLGRCDMAFEMITEAKLLSVARKTAKQLRAEIAKASEG